MLQKKQSKTPNYWRSVETMKIKQQTKILTHNEIVLMQSEKDFKTSIINKGYVTSRKQKSVAIKKNPLEILEINTVVGKKLKDDWIK